MYVGKIVHHPERKTSISNLEIVGNPARFPPCAIRTALPRKEQILVTDPNAGLVCLLNLSEDVQTLSVSHVISGNNIEYYIDCLYFTDNIIVATDRTSIYTK